MAIWTLSLTWLSSQAQPSDPHQPLCGHVAMAKTQHHKQNQMSQPGHMTVSLLLSHNIASMLDHTCPGRERYGLCARHTGGWVRDPTGAHTIRRGVCAQPSPAWRVLCGKPDIPPALGIRVCLILKWQGCTVLGTTCVQTWHLSFGVRS